VRATHVAAFDSGDGTEAVEGRLLDELRRCDGWLPHLSLVAEVDGAVAGHAVCTRAFVGDVAALGLGPIAVDPARQRAGIGSALMHAMLGAADATGEPFVALLGSPAYYGRFGFVPSTDVGIDPPDPAWGEHFQVRTLWAFDPVASAGSFRYASPFGDL
jgi:putative acetyltransferase